MEKAGGIFGSDKLKDQGSAQRDQASSGQGGYGGDRDNQDSIYGSGGRDQQSGGGYGDSGRGGSDNY
jgi:hypothetical protein